MNYHPRELQYYQAVIDYFPVDENSDSSNQDRLYRDRSRERQAEIFVMNSDYEKAQEIYADFARSDLDRLPVVGRAGLAVVLHHQNATEAARSEIIGVESEVDEHLNQFLLKQFKEIRSHYFDPNSLNSSPDTKDSLTE